MNGAGANDDQEAIIFAMNQITNFAARLAD